MASPGPAKRARGISPLALASSEDGNAQKLIVSGDYRASGMTPSLIDKQMIKLANMEDQVRQAKEVAAAQQAECKQAEANARAQEVLARKWQAQCEALQAQLAEQAASSQERQEAHIKSISTLEQELAHARETQADEATQRAEAQKKLVTLRHDLSAARAEAQRERRGGEEALAAARIDAEQVTAQLLSDLERTNGVLRATRDALARRADETREAREGAAAAQAALAEAQADARRRESDLRCAEARLRDAKLVEAEAGTLRERLARLEGLTSAGKQVPELQAQLHSALEAADRQRVRAESAEGELSRARSAAEVAEARLAALQAAESAQAPSALEAMSRAEISEAMQRLQAAELRQIAEAEALRVDAAAAARRAADAEAAAAAHAAARSVARAEAATALQHVAAARAAEAAAVGRLQHVQEFAALRAAEAEAKGAPGAADDRRAAKVLADVAELQAQLAAAQRAQQKGEQEAKMFQSALDRLRAESGDAAQHSAAADAHRRTTVGRDTSASAAATIEEAVNTEALQQRVARLQQEAADMQSALARAEARAEPRDPHEAEVPARQRAAEVRVLQYWCRALEARSERLAAAFAASTVQFREAVRDILGWRVQPHRTAGDGARLAACTLHSHGVEPAIQLRFENTESAGWRAAQASEPGLEGAEDINVPQLLARALTATPPEEEG